MNQKFQFRFRLIRIAFTPLYNSIPINKRHFVFTSTCFITTDFGPRLPIPWLPPEIVCSLDPLNAQHRPESDVWSVRSIENWLANITHFRMFGVLAWVPEFKQFPLLIVQHLMRINRCTLLGMCHTRSGAALPEDI